MLKLTGLTKIIEGKTIVNNINLEIKSGELFGFLGPNGAGKTTTIKMMVGLIKSTSGTIEINGMDTGQFGSECKRIVGYVADVPYLYDRLTGLEYLNVIGSLWSMDKKTLSKNIDTYITLFDLKKFQNDYIMNYSYGTKQKIALCGALIHSPELLILDEPLLSLDPIIAHEIKEFLTSYCKSGNTVFFSTHILEVAERLCTSIGIIRNGNLIAIGSLDEIRNAFGEDLTLEDIFIKVVGSDAGK